MSEKLKVAQLEMTCGACPSQWEGELEDGRAIYIRYRWGRLGVVIAPTMQAALDLFCGFSNVGVHFEAYHVGDYSGICFLSDVAAAVPQVDFSAVCP